MREQVHLYSRGKYVQLDMISDSTNTKAGCCCSVRVLKKINKVIFELDKQTRK